MHETKSEFVGERGKRVHETKSELVEKMEEMPHETESEFGESGGEALHEIMSDFTGAITADRGRGGGGLFSRCGVKPFAQKMTIYLKLRSLRWSVRSIACLTWCTNFQCCARARCGGKRDRAVCRQMYVLCVRGFWRADRLTSLREQRIHL